MAKRKKQEQNDINFSFDNVVKASTDLVSDIDTLYEEKNMNINFSVKSDLITKTSKLLFKIMMNFNKKKSNSRMFIEGVDFIKEKFIKENIFKESPTFFNEIIFKVGRRKASDRTPNKNESEAFQATVPKSTMLDYVSLIYSFYSNNHSYDLSCGYISTAYFFHDFIHLIENNYDDFLIFIKNSNKSKV